MKVLISGYYGFNNTGDEAIALAITRELKNMGHTPILLSNTPEESSATYDCPCVSRMQPLAVTKAIHSADVVLSGGGGLLQDKTSSRNLMYYLGIISLASSLGKKVIIFNQSIGPLSKSGSKKVQRVLRNAVSIVRDRSSLDTLRHLNLPCELGGDPALLLKPSAHVVQDISKVVIAPRGDVTESIGVLQEATQCLQQLNRRVIALSFMPSEDDEAAHSLGADEVISTSNPQVALDVIANSGFVIGVRLHAAILAAAADVPFCGVSYDPKISGFCRDAGAPFHDTIPNIETLIEQSYHRVTPDSAALAEMRYRAIQSFSRIQG